MKSKFVGERTRALWKERTNQGLGLCECIEGGESIEMDFNLGNKPS